MMVQDLIAMREILFNEWDPIGVGDYETALQNGIDDEYDDLIHTFFRLNYQLRQGEIENLLKSYEESLGLDISPPKVLADTASSIRSLLQSRGYDELR